WDRCPSPGYARRCGTRPARRAGTAGAASGRRSASPCRDWEDRSPSGLRRLFSRGLGGLRLLRLFFLRLGLGFRRELDRAAGAFDQRARAFAHLDFLERNLALELARED